MEPMVAVRQDSSDPAATLQDIRRISRQGRPLRDALHELLDNSNKREAALLAQQSRQANRLQGWTTLILLAGGAFTIGLTILLSVQLVTNVRRLTETNSQLTAEVSERKRAEEKFWVPAQQLEAAQQANQRILDYSLDVICTIDEGGCFIQVSPACERVWGMPLRS